MGKKRKKCSNLSCVHDETYTLFGGQEMNTTRQFGVVYTPKRLADYVANLIKEEATKDNYKINSILDPACGEGALLQAVKENIPSCNKFIGIDIDASVINQLKKKCGDEYTYIHNDVLLPTEESDAGDYWRRELSPISAIIANPPWSNIKQHSNEKLDKAGYSLNKGQYDSYVLFIELAFKILQEDGYLAFIIPDSLFDSQNIRLREYLTTKCQIRVIARLGEKMFDGINRATTVIVCKKSTPKENSLTACFRLTTDKRKLFLESELELHQLYNESKHTVYQRRFSSNENFNFNIDTKKEDELILKKIEKDMISWKDYFIFGRGVEISKKGEVVICLHCESAQGYTTEQYKKEMKTCVYCKEKFRITDINTKLLIHKDSKLNRESILVGEDVRRYSSLVNKYIDKGVKGINYKNKIIYSPPKIVIRKTGLGIYANIDYTSSLTSQTVYVLRYKNESCTAPLEFYLGLLNSRVIYYFYLKNYGEVEWKSHPYLTKQIIYSLPLKEYTGSEIDLKIANISKSLSKCYSYKKDLELEKIIMDRYELTSKEREQITLEINSLPNLKAINNMKVEREIRK